MRGIWEENRADVLDEVAVIEDAVSYALEENLDAELRTRAAREAHKIYGAVGSLGFVLAGEHARELERALSGAAPPGAEELPRLAQLVSALRNELEAPVQEGAEATIAARERPVPAVETMELLVIDTNAARGRQIVTEARDRALRAGSATNLAGAREMLGRAAPDVVLLDLSVSDPLESVLSFLGEIARDRPVLVVTDPARGVDRVEVARRGGRGFLPNTLTCGQTVDAVIALRERVRTRGTRILVLDDDPTLFGLLEEVLGTVDMAVSCCHDSSRFLAELEDTSPDLVILDYDMPDVTGPELCRAIRNEQRWEGLPVVFLTGLTDPDSVREVFDAGADDYVSKPFVGPELIARISNRLERIRLYRALAETDPLTGLANRRRSVDAIEGYLRIAGRLEQPLCLAVMDVDEFKGINDTRGHAAGDMVLRGLGTELLRWFRGEDIVARWGGDEFVVAMLGMSGADGRRRIGELLEAMRERSFEGLGVTISAGIAEYPDDGEDVDTLYRAADDALYRAKNDGRNRVAAA